MHIHFVSSWLLKALKSKYITSHFPDIDLERKKLLFLCHYRDGDRTFYLNVIGLNLHLTLTCTQKGNEKKN